MGRKKKSEESKNESSQKQQSSQAKDLVEQTKESNQTQQSSQTNESKKEIEPGSEADGVKSKEKGTILKDFVRKFVQDGWKIPEGDIKLIQEPDFRQVSEINLEGVDPALLISPLSVFLLVVPKPIWDHLASQTTHEMARKVAEGEVNGQYASRYYRQTVTAEEILFIFCALIKFGDLRANDNLKKQFKRRKYCMGHHRFSAVLSSLTCAWGELLQLLRQSFMRLVIPSSAICIDEALYQFNAHPTDQDKNPAPKRYIPRKPHPNGLLTYITAIKLGKNPYVLDLEPNLSYFNPINARDAAIKLVGRSSNAFPGPLHVIVDAGFSGTDFLETLNGLKIKFVASLNAAHFDLIFKGMNSLCPPSHSLALMGTKGYLWSMHKGSEANRTHFILTNAFQGELVANKVEIFSAKSIENLSKLEIPALNFLAQNLGVPLSMDPRNLAEKIAALANQEEGDKISAIQQQGTESNPPLDSFTRAALEKMVVRDLKELIIKNSWGKSGSLSKPELINIVLKAQAVKSSDLEKTEKLLKAAPRPTKDVLSHCHKYYRQNFNSIDLHDKSYYKKEGHHFCRSWIARFILSFLTTGLVNAYAIYSKDKIKQPAFRPFARAVAKGVVKKEKGFPAIVDDDDDEINLSDDLSDDPSDCWSDPNEDLMDELEVQYVVQNQGKRKPKEQAKKMEVKKPRSENVEVEKSKSENGGTLEELANIASQLQVESGTNPKLLISDKVWSPASQQCFDWVNQSCPVDTEVTVLIASMFSPFRKHFLEGKPFRGNRRRKKKKKKS